MGWDVSIFPKRSAQATTESDFILRVCLTCGFEFVGMLTGFDWLTLKDFTVGRKKPRPIDMTKFISALGEFNRLTRRGMEA